MGNLRRRRSNRHPPQECRTHTFNAIIVPRAPRAATNPNMLPTKLLIQWGRMRVGSGRFTPRPANIVAKIGTTFA